MSEKHNSLIDLPKSVDNAIQNLTDKPTQTIGGILSDMFYLVFGGASYYAEKKHITHEHKLNLYKSKLEKNIEKIPSQNLREPNLQTTGQALEDSKFCIESNELIDMFVNLISSSMDSSKISSVHPSFSLIIKQMSSFDAHILLYFKKQPSYPICNYQLKYPDDSYRILMQSVFMPSQMEDNQLTLNKISLSISALCHLGILEITYSRWSPEPLAFSIFENSNTYKLLKDKYEKDKNIVYIQKGDICLTNLGHSFCNTCVPNNFNN